MSALEWILLVSVSIGIICLLLCCFYIGIYSKNKKKLSQLNEQKPSHRRQKKKWRRKVKKIKTDVQKQGKLCLIYLCLAIVSIGIGSYSKYYQLTNMTEIDTENIVNGYYLTTQIEEQIKTAAEKNISEEKLDNNVHELAVRMASFSAKKASDRASTDGQLILNRYYARVGQFGVNISAESAKKLLEDEEIKNNYLQDLKKLKKIQTNVLDFYQVNEKSLSQKK